MSGFKKATRSQARLRLALMGPPGSGKTYTALLLATHLVPPGKIALIDTEHSAASKYAPGPGKKADPERGTFDFDAQDLAAPFHPRRYLTAIREAEAAGYEALVIDSLSHAWVGEGGGLTLHDEAVARQRGTKNAFTAWSEVTPHHQALVEGMLQCGLHIVVTMRTKVAYVQDKDASGKPQVRQVGMEPLMRDGIQYEFDVAADMDLDNVLVVGKTRCKPLKGAVIREPGKDLAATLRTWLDVGAPREAQIPPSPAPSVNGHKPQTIPERIAQAERVLLKEGHGQPGDFTAYLVWAMREHYPQPVEQWPEAAAPRIKLAIDGFRAGERIDPAEVSGPAIDDPF